MLMHTHTHSRAFFQTNTKAKNPYLSTSLFSLHTLSETLQSSKEAKQLPNYLICINMHIVQEGRRWVVMVAKKEGDRASPGEQRRE